MWRRAVSLGSRLLVLWSLAGGHARAEDAREPALEVEKGGDACLVASRLRARLRHFRKPGAVPAGAFRVFVDAASQPVSFRIEQEGVVVAERRFPVLPSACAERVDAIAIAVALAIEHAVKGDETEASTAPAGPENPAANTAPASAPTAPAPTPTPEPQPAQEAQTSTAPAASPANAPAAKPAPPAAVKARPEPARPATDVATPRSAPSSFGARIDAGAGLLLEVLPDPAFAGIAGGELLIGERFAVALQAFLTPTTQTSISPGHVDSQLLGGRSFACYGTRPALFAFEACAGIAAARVTARGRDVVMPATTHLGFVAGLLRAGLRLRLPAHFALRLALDGLANVLRPRLEVQGATPRAGSVVGAAGSLEILFALP